MRVGWTDVDGRTVEEEVVKEVKIRKG